MDDREKFQRACAGLAQGVINISEGHTEIEPGSRIHKSMVTICEMLHAGHVTWQMLADCAYTGAKDGG